MRGNLAVSAVLGGLVCFCSATGAWEYTYGPPTDADFAGRRAAPVTSCPGGGYIVVGTQMFTPGTWDDVKVVRTDSAGAPLWEASYDVQQLGLPDLGVAIVEVPPFGFVFLSNTWFGGVPVPALTHIDCGGNVRWSQVYPIAAGQGLEGVDLIRTQTMVGGGRFELAVAGFWVDGSGGRDGFLMRTDSAGRLIWGWVYDAGGNEVFNALTETPPATGWPPTVGDLVAVGSYVDPLSGDRQGLVARFDGSFGSGPGSCMAHHGDPKAADTYVSVALLNQPLFAGELAMAGVSVDQNGNEQVWLVRGDPCQVLAEARLGDSWGATQEGAYDLSEIANPTLPGSNPGDLAVVGYHLSPFSGSLDATLLLVEPFQLSPLAASLFGGPGDEVFVSVAEERAGGFVMAGQTSSDWQGNGDPSSFYLVTADPAIRGCETRWGPNLDPATWPATPLGWWYQHMLWDAPVLVATANLSNPFQVCP